MDAKWISESAERRTRFVVTDVEPMHAQYDSNDRRFQPASVSVTVSAETSLEDPEGYGPSWEATVRGPYLKADGSVGKQEHVGRYWQGHRDVPEWLNQLGRDCLANAGLGLPPRS